MRDLHSKRATIEAISFTRGRLFSREDDDTLVNGERRREKFRLGAGFRGENWRNGFITTVEMFTR